MARPERSLDPGAGPVPQFAQELRELRYRAGRPPYRQMQRAVYISYSSLSRAADGRKLPTWVTTAAFVTACGDDPATWKPRWEAAQRAAEEAAREQEVERKPLAVSAAKSDPTRTDSFPPPELPTGPAGQVAPSPEEIQTVAQLRAAVDELASHYDQRLISSKMQVSLSTVRLARNWPEQVELTVFERFVHACGVAQDDIEPWRNAWQAAVNDRKQQNIPLPTPGSIHTPEAMREAIETMIRLTSINTVTERMNTTEGTIGRILRGAEHVDAELFARFVTACDAPEDDVPAWLEARRRAIATRDRRQLIAITTPTPTFVAAPVPPEQPPDAPAPPSPTPTSAARLDPTTAATYEELRTALKTVVGTAGLTSTDIEAATSGRLSHTTVTAILDGVIPATGEQLVLLLRTCGLRDEVAQWTATWSRLRGSHLGNPPKPRHAATRFRVALRRIAARTARAPEGHVTWTPTTPSPSWS